MVVSIYANKSKHTHRINITILYICESILSITFISTQMPLNFFLLFHMCIYKYVHELANRIPYLSCLNLLAAQKQTQTFPSILNSKTFLWLF